MKKYFCFLAIGAAAVLGLMLGTGPATAAILTLTYGGFTVEEADPFASGGTPMNTTAVGGGFFSAPANTPTVWRDRTVSAFVTDYENEGGATDRVFDTFNAGPELVTTIFVPAGEYRVAVVYLYAQNDDTSAGLLANLNGVVDSTDASQFYDRGEVDFAIGTAPTGPGTWAVGLAEIGTTPAGATSFTVNVDEFDDIGGGPYGRAGYIGVAYQLVPEPSSFVLLGMGVVGLLFRRRQ